VVAVRRSMFFGFCLVSWQGPKTEASKRSVTLNTAWDYRQLDSYRQSDSSQVANSLIAANRVATGLL